MDHLDTEKAIEVLRNGVEKLNKKQGERWTFELNPREAGVVYDSNATCTIRKIKNSSVTTLVIDVYDDCSYLVWNYNHSKCICLKKCDLESTLTGLLA